MFKPKKMIALLLACAVTLPCTNAIASEYREWHENGIVYGQYGDVFVFCVQRDTKIKDCIIQTEAEKGGPILLDDDVLFSLETMTSLYGYDVTNSADSIELSNGLRDISISKKDKTAYVNKIPNKFEYEIRNETVYCSYKYWDMLFDVDVAYDTEKRCITITERETTPIPEEVLEFRKSSLTYPVSYTDCTNKYVNELTTLKVLSGYDDGTFKPDAFITRAEFSKIISTVTGGIGTDTETLPKNIFSDVAENHWALKYILHCKAATFVDGYDDGTFRPDDNITFAEAVKVCLSAVGYDNLITEDGDNWYEPWLDLAYEHKIIDNQKVDPNKTATRLEVAELAAKTINLPLCIVTGFDMQNPKYDFADGTLDENGTEKPLRTLKTTYLK